MRAIIALSILLLACAAPVQPPTITFAFDPNFKAIEIVGKATPDFKRDFKIAASAWTTTFGATFVWVEPANVVGDGTGSRPFAGLGTPGQDFQVAQCDDANVLDGSKVGFSNVNGIVMDCPFMSYYSPAQRIHLMKHEIGHQFGLLHDETDELAIMYPSVSSTTEFRPGDHKLWNDAMCNVWGICE